MSDLLITLGWSFFIFVFTSCTRGNEMSVEKDGRPEMIYLEHRLSNENFQHLDTNFTVKSYTTIYMGSRQQLIDAISDSVDRSCRNMKMKFLNNPWQLMATDSIDLLLGGHLVYSGRYKPLIEIKVPEIIFNKLMIAEFIFKKKNVVYYFNSNGNYSWLFVKENTTAVDFVFVTANQECPSFYLNFLEPYEIND